MHLLLSVAVLFLIDARANASELGLNVYGFSYHFDRTDSSGNKLHGVNPGAGAQFIIADRNRSVWFADGGVLRNSNANVAKYVGLGYRFKVAYGLQIGAALSLFQSPDNNGGSAFVAPFPLISYRYKRIAVHLVPLPRYKNINRNAAMALYGTFFFREKKG